MEKVIEHLTFLAILAIVPLQMLWAADTQDTIAVHQRHAINFSINGDKRIIVPVKVNDYTLNLMFDTGGAGKVVIDKAVADSIFKNDKLKYQEKDMSNGFEPEPLYKEKHLSSTSIVKLSIGDKNLIFNGFTIDNTRIKYHIDGYFSIPEGDKHVWDIHFANNEISVEDTVYKEDKCISYSIKHINKSKNFFISGIEMKFTQGLYSLSYSGDFLIDTGNSGDVTFLGKRDDVFIENIKKHSINFEYLLNYRSGKVNNSLFFINEANVVNDSLQIMYQRSSGDYINILGLSWLWRFHVIMDLRFNKIYLSKINNNKSLDDINLEQTSTQMVTYSTKEGYLAVCNTNPSGLFYKAGIRKGDVITSVNGRSPMSITPTYFKKETVGKILHFRIIRKGIKMSLPPYLNENLTVKSTESGRSL